MSGKPDSSIDWFVVAIVVLNGAVLVYLLAPFLLFVAVIGAIGFIGSALKSLFFNPEEFKRSGMIKLAIGVVCAIIGITAFVLVPDDFGRSGNDDFCVETRSHFC